MFPRVDDRLSLIGLRLRVGDRSTDVLSLRVKYPFTFQSSLFIISADNRQKHGVLLEKCSPNTQTHALMSHYLRCVIMSHRVSRGGIESNCFRVHLQCLLRCPFLLNWPSIYLHFSVVSILNAVTAAPH